MKTNSGLKEVIDVKENSVLKEVVHDKENTGSKEVVVVKAGPAFKEKAKEKRIQDHVQIPNPVFRSG